MPNLNSNGIKIYYEIHGQGEPLLLIMGLANNSLSWYRSIPELAKHFKVIVFDNRGTGRSDKPLSPYSIELMAKDAYMVLDTLNMESAHIYGVSMGGMIAQRFAIIYPEKVRSLVLGCTTAGGKNHVQPSEEVTTLMMTRTVGTPEEIAWASAPILYSSAFIEKKRDLISEDILKRIEIPTPPSNNLLQLAACLQHDTYDELHKINVPTLVIHGDADVLVPYENGVTLANKIKEAQLITVNGAGHIYITEAYDWINQTVINFLQNQNSN